MIYKEPGDEAPTTTQQKAAAPTTTASQPASSTPSGYGVPGSAYSIGMANSSSPSVVETTKVDLGNGYYQWQETLSTGEKRMIGQPIPITPTNTGAASQPFTTTDPDGNKVTFAGSTPDEFKVVAVENPTKPPTSTEGVVTEQRDFTGAGGQSNVTVGLISTVKGYEYEPNIGSLADADKNRYIPAEVSMGGGVTQQGYIDTVTGMFDYAFESKTGVPNIDWQRPQDERVAADYKFDPNTMTVGGKPVVITGSAVSTIPEMPKSVADQTPDTTRAGLIVAPDAVKAMNDFGMGVISGVKNFFDGVQTDIYWGDKKVEASGFLKGYAASKALTEDYTIKMTQGSILDRAIGASPVGLWEIGLGTTGQMLFGTLTFAEASYKNPSGVPSAVKSTGAEALNMFIGIKSMVDPWLLSPVGGSDYKLPQTINNNPYNEKITAGEVGLQTAFTVATVGSFAAPKLGAAADAIKGGKSFYGETISRNSGYAYKYNIGSEFEPKNAGAEFNRPTFTEVPGEGIPRSDLTYQPGVNIEKVPRSPGVNIDAATDTVEFVKGGDKYVITGSPETFRDLTPREARILPAGADDTRFTSPTGSQTGKITSIVDKEGKWVAQSRTELYEPKTKAGRMAKDLAEGNVEKYYSGLDVEQITRQTYDYVEPGIKTIIRDNSAGFKSASMFLVSDSIMSAEINSMKMKTVDNKQGEKTSNVYVPVLINSSLIGSSEAATLDYKTSTIQGTESTSKTNLAQYSVSDTEEDSSLKMGSLNILGQGSGLGQASVVALTSATGVMQRYVPSTPETSIVKGGFPAIPNFGSGGYVGGMGHRGAAYVIDMGDPFDDIDFTGSKRTKKKRKSSKRRNK